MVCNEIQFPRALYRILSPSLVATTLRQTMKKKKGIEPPCLLRIKFVIILRLWPELTNYSQQEPLPQGRDDLLYLGGVRDGPQLARLN